MPSWDGVRVRRRACTIRRDYVKSAIPPPRSQVQILTLLRPTPSVARGRSRSRDQLEVLSLKSSIMELQSLREPRLRDVIPRLMQQRAEVVAAMASRGPRDVRES
jgi:hypothetical protein